MGRAKSTEVQFSCQECSVVFFVKPSRVKLQRSPVRFCSHKCMSRFQEISARITPFACSVCCEVKNRNNFTGIITKAGLVSLPVKNATKRRLKRSSLIAVRAHLDLAQSKGGSRIS